MYKTVFQILLLAILTALPACKSETSNSVPEKEPTRPESFVNDEAMLDYIERVHFNYMWDGAEPTSGLARERIHLDGQYPEHDQDVTRVLSA